MHKEMESSKGSFRFEFQAMEQSPVEYLEIDSTNSIFVFLSETDKNRFDSCCMSHTV